jgi:phosphoribosylformylglycinamidine synthase
MKISAQPITEEVVQSHGLTQEEYKDIKSMLGREPNLTELGVFSVMWSEHCSYKSSRPHLRTFSTKGARVIQGPGENAGVVDIGDGLAVVFKMESHNHPSFIEPYQGAATGVGGILRDVFTMGARPLALLNSLRFGSPDHPRTKFLVNGVVRGVAGYGNCVGVPTVGGEVYFDPCYNGNILVNAFCLGLVRQDKIFKGIAAGAGNPVFYVGSKTGRDGIHGATMASESFEEDSEEKKPTVQVGDPFTEKLLIEACLEAMKKDLMVGIQDMGAAGLTSSSVEMASRGGMGIELEMALVPRRETEMTPYEILLSESQERMVIVARKGKEREVEEIFRKWDLDVVEIGKVTEDGIFRILENNVPVVEIPVECLTDKAPMLQRPIEKSRDHDELRKLDLQTIPEPSDYKDTLLKLLASPNISSKEWIYQQYDHMVRLNTIVLPGSDSSLIRIPGTDKAVAISVDCNSRYVFLDPYLGGKIAVSESARNVAASGARPIAVTDCLNFGNPEKPEVMWQLVESIRGIRDACLALDTPVIGGNVSLYNETNGKSIYPTPTIGMVGLLEQADKHATQWFKDAGDKIYLLGETFEEIGGSEYLATVHGLVKGIPPELDLEKEKALQELLIECIKRGILKSAHDCSEGGLAVAVAECCVSGPQESLGAKIVLPEKSIRTDAYLFGESQSRAVVSLSQGEIEEALLDLAREQGVPVFAIGVVGGNSLEVSMDSKHILSIDTALLQSAWKSTIPGIAEG